MLLSQTGYVPCIFFNSYGLFAVMTTSRPEIIILGSDDRENWFPYEFKWKPGNVANKPEFIAPHQPRLDWQMWFAALSNYERNPWLIQFMIRLLQGSPPVIDLLENNPYPKNPPKYMQALVYDYRFSDSENSEPNRLMVESKTPETLYPHFAIAGINSTSSCLEMALYKACLICFD